MIQDDDDKHKFANKLGGKAVDSAAVMGEYIKILAAGVNELRKASNETPLMDRSYETDAACIQSISNMALTIVAHNHGMAISPTSLAANK